LFFDIHSQMKITHYNDTIKRLQSHQMHLCKKILAQIYTPSIDIETNQEVTSKIVLKVGQQYYFESKKAIFLTGGSYDHCIQYFDVYNEIHFKYGPKMI
jgi:hypothetical protein